MFQDKTFDFKGQGGKMFYTKQFININTRLSNK